MAEVGRLPPRMDPLPPVDHLASVQSAAQRMLALCSRVLLAGAEAPEQTCAALEALNEEVYGRRWEGGERVRIHDRPGSTIIEPLNIPDSQARHARPARRGRGARVVQALHQRRDAQGLPRLPRRLLPGRGTEPVPLDVQLARQRHRGRGGVRAARSGELREPAESRSGRGLRPALGAPRAGGSVRRRRRAHRSRRAGGADRPRRIEPLVRALRRGRAGRRTPHARPRDHGRGGRARRRGACPYRRRAPSCAPRALRGAVAAADRFRRRRRARVRRRALRRRSAGAADHRPGPPARAPPSG